MRKIIYGSICTSAKEIKGIRGYEKKIRCYKKVYIKPIDRG